MSLTVALLLVLVGLVLLAGGGEALVRAATTLAELAGVSPAVIGLTVVAIGTSLPELVVSLVAAQEGQPDLAIANVVGSNIFNVLGIIGVTALVRPVPVNPAVVGTDLWWMLGTTVLLLPLLWSGGRLSRLEGGLLVAAYGAYLAVLLR